jgi:acetylornithine deacetylase
MSPSPATAPDPQLAAATQSFLCDLMRFPSTPGQEAAAMDYLRAAVSNLGCEVTVCPLSNAIRQDRDYSDPIPDIEYDGRYCLRVRLPGSGGGQCVLFNTHIDVVPASEGMAEAFTPRVEQGIVYGRGACDAKGQAACLYALLRALRHERLAGDAIVHFVVEEENGGNGSLAMARRGERADACVVLEPTDGHLYTSVRGAVWFRLVFRGKAGHSGTAGATRSALLLARDAMAVLESYHADLLRASRGLRLFDGHPNPMPLTFGRLQAGNWPAAAPSAATLEGVLELLPNKSKEQVMAEFRDRLLDAGHFTPDNLDIHFMYRHDSSVLDPDHALPLALLRAASTSGRPLTVAGMPASCDAWFYNNQLGIPTVVAGPGSLKVAHSREEQIALADVLGFAALLGDFVRDYCNRPKKEDAQ